MVAWLEIWQPPIFAAMKLFEMNILESLLTCRDVHCSDITHREDIDYFVSSLLHNIESSGLETLPLNVSRKKFDIRKKMPVWKELVEPYQDKAQFWHAITIDARGLRKKYTK